MELSVTAMAAMEVVGDIEEDGIKALTRWSLSVCFACQGQYKESPLLKVPEMWTAKSAKHFLAILGEEMAGPRLVA